MEHAVPTPAVAADAAAVTEVVMAIEAALYGEASFTQADLEDEWSELDIEENVRVVRDGGRIVGYGVAREHGELSRAEGYVHPDAWGRGIGKLIATRLEEDAARRGARRIQNAVFEVDPAARRLLEALDYDAVRVFRELRIELEAPPPAAEWPDGLRVVAFDPQRDALDFHAAQQEAFADHWDFSPRDFASWSTPTLGRALRPGALVRRPRRGRDRRGDDLHGRHVRRGLGPRAVHPPPVAQAGRRRGPSARRVRALLGAWRAQRRAGRRRGERDRGVSALRARRYGARARLGRVREELGPEPI